MNNLKFWYKSNITFVIITLLWLAMAGIFLYGVHENGMENRKKEADFIQACNSVNGKPVHNGKYYECLK